VKPPPISCLCDVCALLIATDEFHGCCSQSCLDQLLQYMSDLDDLYEHVAHWTELA